MKKLLPVLLCLMILSGCRSRKKMKYNSEIKHTELIKTDTNTVVSIEKKVQEVAKEVRKTEKKEQINEGEIIIKGKTDSANAFKFHNIVNGDTVSIVTISGNAEFYVKNNYKDNNVKTSDSIASEKLNVVAQIARAAVSSTTIKDVAESIKSKEVEVKATGFALPVYVIILLVVGLMIGLIFLYKKFGGMFLEKFKNFKI